MIKHTLQTGRQGTPMISFSKKGLKDKQINDIVAYVRSFEKVKKDKVVAKNEPALIKVKSSYSFKESVANLKKAVKGANFRIVRTQAFDSGLKSKAKESKDKVIVYFCNFKMLNDALAVDPRVGLFLPCRVTVAKIGKDVYFYAINPVRLSRLFNNSELDTACANIKKLYVEIMEEANL
jgi:cytochrome c oxidase cbb3-type subunit 3